jgi:hypothetical protein
MPKDQGYGDSVGIYYDTAHLEIGDMPNGELMLNDQVFRRVYAPVPENALTIRIYAMHKGHKEVGRQKKSKTICGWETITNPNTGKQEQIYTCSEREIDDYNQARMFIWLNGERLRKAPEDKEFEKDTDFDNYHLEYKKDVSLDFAGKPLELKVMAWNYHAKMDDFDLNIVASLPD